MPVALLIAEPTACPKENITDTVLIRALRTELFNPFPPLILNISSLQLIPVNIIAYRSQYGSTNPTGIIGAGLLATLVSTVTACVYCKIKEG